VLAAVLRSVPVAVRVVDAGCVSPVCEGLVFQGLVRDGGGLVCDGRLAAEATSGGTFSKALPMSHWLMSIKQT